MSENGDEEYTLGNKTDAFLMIDKKERKLLRQILYMTLESETGKTYISKKLGPEYIQIGQTLLRTLED